MQKKRFFMILATFFCVANIVGGADTFPSKEHTAHLVHRLGESGAATKTERDKILSRLNSDYVEVREEVLRILSSQEAGSTSAIEYLSPLHCAMLLTSFWRIAEAEDYLLRLIECQIDSSTMPPGIEVPGSYFFPAAEALVDIRVKPSKLLMAISLQDESKISSLVWVLVKTQGRNCATMLLKQDVSGTQYKESRLKEALLLLENTGEDKLLLLGTDAERPGSGLNKGSVLE